MGLLAYLLLLLLVPASPRMLGARMLSLGEAVSSMRAGVDVAAWGGVILTGGVAEDATPQALAVLRHAARRVKARCGCPLASLHLLGGVASASVQYSETGEGPTTIAVSIAGQPEGLGWDEIPELGRVYAVTLHANVSGSACAPALQEHNLTLSLSIPDSDVNVIAHTWGDAPRAVAAVGMEVEADGRASAGGGAAAPLPPGSPPPVLRALSYNVWNVNPPRWLHRDHRDRFRAYALRMHALSDIARDAGAAIIAFQEVRYDSTLGGFGDSPQTHNPWAAGGRGGPSPPVVPASAPPPPPPSPVADLYATALAAVVAEAEDPAVAVHAAMPAVSRNSPYTLAVAWAVSSLWWNKTMGEIGQSEAYRTRNAEKWAAVTAAPGWTLYGGSAHPREGQQEEGGGGGEGEPAAPIGRSPYTRAPPTGPRSWSEAQATFLDHPHAQVRPFFCVFLLACLLLKCALLPSCSHAGSSLSPPLPPCLSPPPPHYAPD